MPDTLASNNSLSEITRGINNKLQDLKLVKERSSKNINEESNLITGSMPQEPSAKTSFNNDENNDDKNVDSHQDKDTVCVQKVMQVRPLEHLQSIQRNYFVNPLMSWYL